jgi:hypothetical protein
MENIIPDHGVLMESVIELRTVMSQIKYADGQTRLHHYELITKLTLYKKKPLRSILLIVLQGLAVPFRCRNGFIAWGIFGLKVAV